MRYSIITASCLLATASAIPSHQRLHARHDHSSSSHGSHEESADAALTTSRFTSTSTLTSYASGAPYGTGNGTAILPTGTGTGLFHPQSASPSIGKPDAVDSAANAHGQQGAAGSDNSGDGSSGFDTPAFGSSGSGSANSGTGNSGSPKNDASANESDAGINDAVKPAACDASTVTVTQNSYVTVTVAASGAAAPSPVKPQPVDDAIVPGKVESASPSKQSKAQSSAQAEEASPSSHDAAPSKATGTGNGNTNGEPVKDAKDTSSKPTSNDEPVKDDVKTKPTTSSAAATSPSSSNTATTPSKAPTSNAPSAGGKLPFRTKRGILASGDAILPLASAFKDSKVSWLSNWYSEAPKSIADSITFVPQNYGKQSDIKGEWTKNAQKAVDAGTKYFLSFGEPGTENEKLFMTPAEAVDLWMKVMEPFAKQGVTIGAPGTLQNDKDFDWLTEFLDLCKECTIGFVAQHWYWKSTEVKSFQETVQKAKKVAGGRPVWVTNFQPSGDSAAQKEFLGKVVPWLDQQDYVQAYAYVPTAIQNGGDPGMTDGDNLNDLGKYYANL